MYFIFCFESFIWGYFVLFFETKSFYIVLADLELTTYMRLIEIHQPLPSLLGLKVSLTTPGSVETVSCFVLRRICSVTHTVLGPTL